MQIFLKPSAACASLFGNLKGSENLQLGGKSENHHLMLNSLLGTKKVRNVLSHLPQMLMFTVGH